MPKAIVKIGYLEFVMDSKVALNMFQTLNSGAEIHRVDTDWVKDEKGNSQPVRKLKAANSDVTLVSVSDTDYAVWKLAGGVMSND